MTLFLSPRLAGVRVVGLLACLLAVAASASTPSIIPLPVQIQVRSGIFTLCPTQKVAGAIAQATTKIFVDGSSLESGQFLAATLLKSTGYRFAVATNGSGGPIRGAIRLTTKNTLSTLGIEGYELTV